MPQPVIHERLDMSREIRKCLRSGALSGFPESDQQRYPNEGAAGGVLLFGEATDVAVWAKNSILLKTRVFSRPI
jgi:hypothetical protein